MRQAPLINLLVVTFILLSNHSSMSLPNTKVFPQHEADRHKSRTSHTHSPEEDEPQDELEPQAIVDSEITLEEDNRDQDLDFTSSESTRPPPTRRKHHKHHHHHHHRRHSDEQESDGDGDDEEYHIIKQVRKRKVPPHKLKTAKLRSFAGSSEEEGFAPSSLEPPSHPRTPIPRPSPASPSTHPSKPVHTPHVPATRPPKPHPPSTTSKPKAASHPKSHPTQSTSLPPSQTPPARRSVTNGAPVHKPTGSLVSVPKMNKHKYDNLLVDLPDYEDSDEGFKFETTSRPIGLLVNITKGTNIPEAFADSLIIDLKEELPTEKPTTAKPTTTKPTTTKPTTKKPTPTTTKPHPTTTKPKPTTTKPHPTTTKPKPTATKPHPTTKPLTHPTQPPITPKPKPKPTTTKKSVIVQVLDLMEDENATPKPMPSNSSMGNGKKDIKLVEQAGYRPEAKCKNAIYRGKIMDLENSNTVFLFYGIGYAAPPIDNLRFKPPFPPDLQSQMRDGYIDSIRMNPPCFPSRIGRTSTSGAEPKNQTEKDHGNSERGDSVTIASEDCLYLNMWLPDKVVLDDEPGSVALYPVIVWIHGEGFLSGMNTEDYRTIAEFVAATDFIVVTIQYRSGVFGFLHLTSTESTGNMGLQDQVQALKWIEESVECFGGDPQSVTLMGHDIGAAFVGYHLLSKISPGYFSRAVMLGGSPLQPHMFQTSQTAEKKAMDLASQVGCVASKSRKAIMECLLSMDPVSIWEVQIMLLQQGHNVLTFPFVPTADGLILTNSPDKLLESGHGKTSEVLLGGSANEGSLVLINSVEGILPYDPTFLSYDKFLAIMRHILGTFGEVEMDMVLHQYKNWVNLMDGFENQIKVADAMGDYYFTCPLRKFSDFWSSRGLPTFHFSFSHQSSAKNRAPWMGAVHGDELDFIFGVPVRFPDKFSSDEVELSRKMMKMLEDFIKLGVPSDEWERYGREVPHYADIAAGGYVFYGNATVPKYGPRMEHCAFWNDLFPKLQALSGPMLTGNGMAYTPVVNRYNFIPPPSDSNGTNINSPHTFNVDDNCYVALHNCSRSNFAVYVNK